MTTVMYSCNKQIANVSTLKEHGHAILCPNVYIILIVMVWYSRSKRQSLVGHIIGSNLSCVHWVTSTY